MTINRRLFFTCLLLGTSFAQMAIGADRLKLWEIVSKQCVPHQQMQQDPTPCVEVDIDKGIQDGYVVFPDRNGVAQFLLIPTRKITGIESALITKSDTPHYWQHAWDARAYVFDRLQKVLPWDAVGLAINAQSSRSQDQFHIHVDCLSPEISHQLQQHGEEIGTNWSKTSFELAGHHYMAKRVSDLNNINPFKSMIDDLGVKASEMGKETLVITGGTVNNEQDFILLEDHVDLKTGDLAHGEDLLDATCAIAE